MSACSYRLKIQYNGAEYFGWQIQNGQINKTIQSELNQALERISKSKCVYTIASGRTDAGVHALGQIVRADITIDLDPGALCKGLNSLLPADIRVITVERCGSDFSPIGDSLWKEYVYIFSPQITPFSEHLCAAVSHDMSQTLMQQAAGLFVGEHDFKNFYCTGSDINSTVRRIFECDLGKYSSLGFWKNMAEEYYLFRVRGNGFLRHMVRLMMGAVWDVGRGKVTLEQLRDALDGASIAKLSPVAPAAGLYLREVCYPGQNR